MERIGFCGVHCSITIIMKTDEYTTRLCHRVAVVPAVAVGRRQ